MTGCTKGEYTAPGGTVNESGFRLSVVTKNMSREEVVTRASDPKTEAEREIKELHVSFLFGPDGKYLQARQDGGGHSYQGYQSVKGTSTLRIDNEGFADNAYASRATVYVVANVEPLDVRKSDRGRSTPERIPDETAFEGNPLRTDLPLPNALGDCPPRAVALWSGKSDARPTIWRAGERRRWCHRDEER